MKVVVGIKALNEERHIAASLESALASVAPFGGGVVLADSGSSDRTIEIARGYPGVRILQLANPAERGCGTGAQLAFQSVEAEYFYLLDGDMVLDPAFLAAGIAFLDAHPDHAAVGGVVREANTDSIEFELRARNDRIKGSAVAGEVDRLDCGGLYRVAAVRQVGYFADRNLHAFEEFELAARLRARGWRLSRIDVPAVEHHGHSTGGYKLMLRRLRSGYAGGPGEVIRAAWGHAHWPQVLRHFAQLRYSVAVVGWWSVLLLLLALGQWLAAAVLLVLPTAFLSWRRRSGRLGLYSFVTWNLIALGFLQGLFRPRRSPADPIRARQLSGGGE
ncbi:glycosyltransferase [Sphingomonas sp. Y38-1Y]|uniref:glycosyltransferase n=1 Tax=Sphingomonas sp. Y38-1Y TaxID=3078265 RepID=UPI0028E469A3|nr:glycosyltransferase [Sphingomonas sp. Y38-1Y]